MNSETTTRVPLHNPLPAGQVPHPVVRADRLSKVYGKGDNEVVALRKVSVEMGRGQLTAIMGPSGSGKSTLMHCLAGLDSPTSGSIRIEGKDITKMNQRQLTRLRRDDIGFIFQSFNLIPTLTAKENITLPADIAGKPISAERFNKVVDAVGLGDRLDHRPSELSGGQQQRVACARALVTEPAVVFADEPTGNLDSAATKQVLKFLRRAVDQLRQTVVMVTHEPEAAAWADRVIFLADGQLVGELWNPTRDDVLDALRYLGDEDQSVSYGSDVTTTSTRPAPRPKQVTAAIPAGPEREVDQLETAQARPSHSPKSAEPKAGAQKAGAQKEPSSGVTPQSAAASAPEPVADEDESRRRRRSFVPVRTMDESPLLINQTKQQSAPTAKDMDEKKINYGSLFSFAHAAYQQAMEEDDDPAGVYDLPDHEVDPDDDVYEPVTIPVEQARLISDLWGRSKIKISTKPHDFAEEEQKAKEKAEEEKAAKKRAAKKAAKEKAAKKAEKEKAAKKAEKKRAAKKAEKEKAEREKAEREKAAEAEAARLAAAEEAAKLAAAEAEAAELAAAEEAAEAARAQADAELRAAEAALNGAKLPTPIVAAPVVADAAPLAQPAPVTRPIPVVDAAPGGNAAPGVDTALGGNAVPGVDTAPLAEAPLPAADPVTVTPPPRLKPLPEPMPEPLPDLAPLPGEVGATAPIPEPMPEPLPELQPLPEGYAGPRLFPKREHRLRAETADQAQTKDSDALRAQLEADVDPADLPPDAQHVVSRARRILDDLPGSILKPGGADSQQ